MWTQFAVCITVVNLEILKGIQVHSFSKLKTKKRSQPAASCFNGNYTPTKYEVLLVVKVIIAWFHISPT